VRKKQYKRIVQKGGVINCTPFGKFLVSPDLIGTTGHLDLDGLKFYPISNPEHAGYDAQELNTHV